MTIGERIQNLRKSKGLSQEELAEQVEVSKQSVSKWELDKSVPNIEKILKLCDVFAVSADFLLRGNHEPSGTDESMRMDAEDEASEPDDAREASELEHDRVIPSDMVSENREKKKNIYAILLGVSAALSIIMMIIVYKVAIYNNLGIKNDSGQDLAYVDRIYDQYTKADVVYYSKDEEFITKTVYLDLNGVNEGDWIFCYPDSEKSDRIRFSYRTDTCIKLIIIMTVFIILSIIFAVLCIRNRKKRSGYVAFLTIFLLLAVCGTGKKNQRQVLALNTANAAGNTALTLHKDGMETEGAEDFQMIPKADGALNLRGFEVKFSVPEGMFSTGIGKYDDLIYESYYDENMLQKYYVSLSSMILYDDIDAYIKDRYSKEETDLSASAEISRPKEEIISGNTVKYITVSYESKGSLYQEVYAGILLPTGMVFEVEAAAVDFDGEFGFEHVRPFFENLEVAEK